METFERTLAVAAPAEEVFQYAATVENLPRWVPAVTEAHSTGGGRVQVSGEFNGNNWTAAAQLEADEASHVVRWRTEGAEGGMVGSLEVRPGDATGTLSELRLRLDLAPGAVSRGRAADAPTAREDGVQDALAAALLGLRDRVENRVREV